MTPCPDPTVHDESPWRRANRRWLTLLVLGAAACAPSPDDTADADRLQPADHEEAIARVAARLQPAIQLAGRQPQVWTLEQRMQEHQVPAVGMAVLADGEVAWHRVWGLADPAEGVEAGPNTLFQAASISKPVAALVALSLVDEGLLDLDEPVNRRLTSWQVPPHEGQDEHPVTLRHLLTHSAGTTVWGFPGYRKDQEFSPGKAIPSNIEVLDGDGNTDPVTVFRRPGEAWQYSGGGFTVVEQLIEDVTGRPFAEVARERVLVPAGMISSTFEQPLPPERWSAAARGHRGDGSEVEGEWHNYPEQAAAGLWTTAADLATLSAHLLDILRSDADPSESPAAPVVSRATMEAMLTPNGDPDGALRGWGLGVGLGGEGAGATFRHGGSNEGFKAQWITARDPAQGYGVAVMANGDRGSALASELVRAVAEIYDWPGHEPTERAARPVSTADAAQYAGRYARPERPEMTITISAAGDGETLRVDVPGQGAFTLHLDGEEDDLFFDPVDASEIHFERDEEGGAVVAARTGGEDLWQRLPEA